MSLWLRLLLCLGGAATLAWVARFVAGRGAAIAVWLSTMAYASMFDDAPPLFWGLSLVVALVVRTVREQAMKLWFAVGSGCLLVLLWARAPVAPAAALLLGWAVTLAAIAYRGWAAKQLLD